MDIPIEEVFNGEDEDDGSDHPSMEEESFIPYGDIPVEEF